MPDQREPTLTPPQPRTGEEPFPCPACGQMLASACRICVACRQPVDPSKILWPHAPASVASPQDLGPLPRALELVRFPWRIFFLIFAAGMVGASVVQQLWGPKQGQLVLGGVQILSAVWVFYDAQQKGLPKPLRWGLGVLLVWIIIFPWYLARRNKRAAACPFVEGPAGRQVPALLILLIIVILFLLIKGLPAR
jgi:hypothetical protein